MALQVWRDRNGIPILAGLAMVLLVAVLQFAGVSQIDRMGLLLFDCSPSAPMAQI